MKNYIINHIYICLVLILNSCVFNSKEEKPNLNESKINSNLRKLSLSINKNKKVLVYLDSLDNIIQISNDGEEKYKIAFDNSGFISYVKNNYHSSFYHQLWLNDKFGVVVFDEFYKKIKRRVMVSETRNPTVSLTSTFLEDDNLYLSENKIFDFKRMQINQREYTEYISLLDSNNQDFILNKKSKLHFKLNSKFKKNSLIVGDFNSKFQKISQSDTMIIDKIFEVEFIPKKTYDTLRFIIWNDRKSIYYELPIKSIR